MTEPFGVSMFPFFFCASSRTPSLVSAYKPRRHRQWRRAPLARYLEASSLNKRLVCEPLSRSAIYEAVEPRQGVVLHIPLVQAEGKFVNVAVKVCDASWRRRPSPRSACRLLRAARAPVWTLCLDKIRNICYTYSRYRKAIPGRCRPGKREFVAVGEDVDHNPSRRVGNGGNFFYFFRP